MRRIWACIQADADRQLPAVSVSFQAAGHTNLDEVQVVLLKPSDTIISQPSRQEKRFADGRRETLDKHPATWAAINRSEFW